MVNKLNFANRFARHTLHRNVKSLSIITRNSIIKTSQNSEIKFLMMSLTV